MLAIDIVGYAAAGFVLAAFCMQSMCNLRVLAILSNLAFITYAYRRDLFPILLLHVILLPLNAWRLYHLPKLEPSKLQSRRHVKMRVIPRKRDLNVSGCQVSD